MTDVSIADQQLRVHLFDGPEREHLADIVHHGT